MIKLEVKDFNLKQTLECGQCFRFKKINDNNYIVQTKDYIANILQKNNYLEIESNYENRDFWINYFDLNTDYEKIKKELKKDPIIKEIIEKGEGIHILKQDFFETMISFITSQNKQIPQIKQCIELFSRKYGNLIEFQGTYYYSFPSSNIEITLEGLTECKVGFRNKYINDAYEKYKQETFKNIETLLEEEQKEKLLSVKGIGEKVCNCIMLFSLNRTKRFPIDVWIKREMERLYFKGKETPKEEIDKKAKELYGKYSGYAQQYIFYGAIKK